MHLQQTKPEALQVDGSRVEMTQYIRCSRLQLANESWHLLRQIWLAQEQWDQRFAQPWVGMAYQAGDQGRRVNCIVGRCAFTDREMTNALGR